MRSTFEPLGSLCAVGSLHFVPANHEINLMEQNGTHHDKSYNHKLITESTYFVNVVLKYGQI